MLKTSPITLKELYAAMCAALPVGASTDICWSVTGEAYVEHAAKTSFDEGSESRLCRWLWDELVSELGGVLQTNGRSLYWRIQPEIATWDENDNFDSKDRAQRGPPNWVARIYARYLISDKPALPQCEQTTEALVKLGYQRGWKRPIEFIQVQRI